MKKLMVILFITACFTSCKEDAKTPVLLDVGKEEVNIREISGNFIYYVDAAVLQTKSELFGVVENEKALELIKMAEPLKDKPSDEVVVTLKVKVVKKPEHEEGWENRIEIIEIINVSKVDQKDSDIIRLKSEN